MNGFSINLGKLVLSVFEIVMGVLRETLRYLAPSFAKYANIHLSTRNQPNIELRDFIEHHLSRGGLYHYDRDSLQESKEDISREYPLLKTRDNLNSDYLYNLFKKIAE